ncbi:hypothetical protein N7488_000008 [Penicillium malachiteum]|nr:hypothetical protein N7488_000008 [Penicillium malachiteum]
MIGVVLVLLNLLGRHAMTGAVSLPGRLHVRIRAIPVLLLLDYPRVTIGVVLVALLLLDHLHTKIGAVLVVPLLLLDHYVRIGVALVDLRLLDRSTDGNQRASSNYVQGT